MKNFIILGIIMVALTVIAVPAYAMTPKQAHRLEIATAVLASLKSASQTGDPNVQAALGYYYFVENDYAKSVYWFRKAAEQGNAYAEVSLGSDYHFGQGVAQDDAKAVYWYRKAAAQGNAAAEVSLGVAYVYGLGMPQDYVQAVKWLILAKASGVKHFMMLSLLESGMATQAQVAEGQRLASQWWKAHHKP